MSHRKEFAFWLRWVAANSVGETIGLGTTFLVGFGLLARSGEAGGIPSALLFAGAAALLGMFEGLVVGVAQGSVLTRRLPGSILPKWTLATIAGALMAWILGMLPSTLMSLNSSGVESVQPEMPDWIIYLLAMLLGAVAGFVLAFVQWIALRRRVSRAWLWLPANSAAWLVGMPIIFAGTSAIQPNAGAFEAALIMLASIAVAGTAVGAVHGIVLVRILFAGKLRAVAA